MTIRTALVLAGFAAMGLTSLAEQLADRVVSDPAPYMSVGVEETMPAKGLRLTQKIVPVPADADTSPWI